jgi:hypothetical protein
MPTAREISASHRMMQVTEWELQRILLDIHEVGTGKEKKDPPVMSF